MFHFQYGTAKVWQTDFCRGEPTASNPLEQSPLKACTCGCNEFIPETAVFDTWATSSVTPLINAHYKETDDISDEIFPMGMRSQAQRSFVHGHSILS